MINNVRDVRDTINQSIWIDTTLGVLQLETPARGYTAEEIDYSCGINMTRLLRGTDDKIAAFTDQSREFSSTFSADQSAGFRFGKDVKGNVKSLSPLATLVTLRDANQAVTLRIQEYGSGQDRRLFETVALDMFGPAGGIVDLVSRFNKSLAAVQKHRFTTDEPMMIAGAPESPERQNFDPSLVRFVAIPVAGGPK